MVTETSDTSRLTVAMYSSNTWGLSERLPWLIQGGEHWEIHKGLGYSAQFALYCVIAMCACYSEWLVLAQLFATCSTAIYFFVLFRRSVVRHFLAS